MIDVAKARGIKVHSDVLQTRLGTNVLPLVARTGKGTSQVLSMLENSANIPAVNFKLDYGIIVEQAVSSIEQELRHISDLPDHRWVALQFLEQNPVIMQFLKDRTDINQLLAIRENCQNELQNKNWHLPFRNGSALSEPTTSARFAKTLWTHRALNPIT